MRKRIIVMVVLIAAAFICSYGSGVEVGKIHKVDKGKREVHVSTKSGQRLNMGDRLQVETDDGKIVLEVTFPMLTLSKCKIRGKGRLSDLSKGMRVYRYSKDEPAEDSAVKPGKTDVFGNMEFCYIPGGTFLMGAPKDECRDSDGKSCWDGELIYNEKRHKVTLSPFWMGKYEVTQKQYENITGENPSTFKGSNLPVEEVNWYDAVEFCNKMSERHGLKPYYVIDKSRKDPNNKNEYDDIDYDNFMWIVKIAGGNGFRLPTEAEWEYACRAGTTTRYYWGNEVDGDYMWYSYNSNCKTHPVGTKRPNAWGLYDMNGNQEEWCWDWCGEYSGDVKDPVGVDSGFGRVVRGGGYVNDGGYLRSAYRYSGRPDGVNTTGGFRVVRSAD